MRSFIAIDLDHAQKKAIAAFQNEIRTQVISGRWKYVDNFHLTLKFLGEISSESAEILSRRLDQISGVFPSLSLQISCVGSFPPFDPRLPHKDTAIWNLIKVLWLGFNGDLKLLFNLQKIIEDDLVRLGFGKEGRIYKPHMTIGQDIMLKDGFAPVEDVFARMVFQKMDISSIILFKSEQLGGKRVYTPVSVHKLGNASERAR